MGQNGNATILQQTCPHRDYQSCFSQAMARRYPSPQLFHPNGRGEDPSLGPAQYAQRLFPSCTAADARASSAAIVHQLPQDDGPGESFTSSALTLLASSSLLLWLCLAICSVLSERSTRAGH